MAKNGEKKYRNFLLILILGVDFIFYLYRGANYISDIFIIFFLELIILNPFRTIFRKVLYREKSIRKLIFAEIICIYNLFLSFASFGLDSIQNASNLFHVISIIILLITFLHTFVLVKLLDSNKKRRFS